MRLLLLLLLGASLAAGAGLHGACSRASEPASAPQQSSAAEPRASGGGERPEPSAMSLPELCEFVTREYREAEGGWGTVLLDEAFVRLTEAKASGETRRIVDALQLLSENLLIHGRNDEAVEHLERAMSLAVGIDAPRKRLDGLRMALGIAELRRGETSHCIDSHNADSCLFPIAGGGVWANPSAAEAALSCFLEVLEGSPDDRPARWLLNLAAMAAGTWPDAVPEELRLPDELVSAEGELPRFPDVAGKLGLATDDCAGGAIIDDFDNDGFLDLVTSSATPASRCTTSGAAATAPSSCASRKPAWRSSSAG